MSSSHSFILPELLLQRGWEDGTRWKEETELEDVVRGIYYVTLRYRNNLQQQIELMILPPGINLLNYGWMPGVEGSVRLNYSYIYQR